MKNLFFILLFFLIFACSQKNGEISTKITEKSLEAQMIDAYNEGVKALEDGDVLYATKKFNESELLFPQSDWAPRASLMASYAYYGGGYYNNSVQELKRFLKLYPKHQNLDYVYYLLAINYYESIIDEKKDLRPLTEAQKYFNFIINEFPETDYALDGKYKLKLIEDILAAKEIYIARYYIKKEKWIAAVKRLKFIVKNYDTTIYVEEALHRLVEVYYIIGLEDEAKKYAKTLGYNYQSGEWYKQSYKVFNRDYEIEEKKKKKGSEKKLLNKIRSFF